MRKFDKSKVNNALKAIDDCCLHCKEHTDECELVKAENELKKCLSP